MAKVLGIVGSARKDGYTIKVLNEALEGAKSVDGVDAECVYLLDYKIRPCTSCYECIRSFEHRCIQQDDMGRGGDSRLWKLVEQANGLLLASPVHQASADALMHLFLERLYPFLWSGELRGMPVATIAVASNQGFQIIANMDLCRWSFAMSMKYVGGLAVHTAYIEDALKESRNLGIKIGKSALDDEKKGRKPLTDEEIWFHYEDKPWSVFENYIENLTMGTRKPELSIIRKALISGSFKNKDALKLLKKANEEFEKYAQLYSLKDYRGALRKLVKSSAYWTHATWKEFLEDNLVKTKPPKTYRPIPENH